MLRANLILFFCSVILKRQKFLLQTHFWALINVLSYSKYVAYKSKIMSDVFIYISRTAGKARGLQQLRVVKQNVEHM